MIAVKTCDARAYFKKINDMVTAGEKVLISRPRNKNLVIIGEDEYNTLEKARRNAEYLAKINRSIQQFRDGHVVVKTMTEE